MITIAEIPSNIRLEVIPTQETTPLLRSETRSETPEWGSREETQRRMQWLASQSPARKASLAIAGCFSVIGPCSFIAFFIAGCIQVSRGENADKALCVAVIIWAINYAVGLSRIYERLYPFTQVDNENSPDLYFNGRPVPRIARNLGGFSAAIYRRVITQLEQERGRAVA